MIRIFRILLALVLASYIGVFTIPIHAQSERALRLLENQCFDCHDGDSAEGNLDLRNAIEVRPWVKELRQWKNVAKRIELGDMPPADHATLSEAQKKTFADWFETHIEKFDYDSIRNPGYEPARRLAHYEYRHSIRDLFGADLADLSRFPKDLSGQSGFENSANTLFLQGSLLECYVQSAESIVDKIFEANPDGLMIRVRKKLVGGIKPSSLKSVESKRSAAKQILLRLCKRAFRRPVKSDELQSLMAIFDDVFEQDRDWTAGLKKAVATILVMPQFLFRGEFSVPKNTPTKIDEFELANRLSYFLWASMPDQRLLELASKNELSNSEVLSLEIDRMLKNRRARSLGYIFAAQWLGFDDVGVRRRQDPIDNPWCTQTLMDSMRAESSMFFYSLVRDNQPVARLIDARYTYLNEELARHYRIKGVEGNRMRPVRLKTKRRGGILTHASVLSVTAFPDRTSPVVRGKWILETILGTPPPDPPPNVSEISEEILESDRLSFREKLQHHSRNKNCYACHQEIDPLGFSLENYDNFGRWRTRAYGERIVAKGQLPDGTKFSGADGLKKVILEQREDDLAKQVTRKLMAYGLGRKLEYFDEAAIRKIVAESKSDGYRFQSLIKGVVNSYPFQFQQLTTDQ